MGVNGNDRYPCADCGAMPIITVVVVQEFMGERKHWILCRACRDKRDRVREGG